MSDVDAVAAATVCTIEVSLFSTTKIFFSWMGLIYKSFSPIGQQSENSDFFFSKNVCVAFFF